MKKLLLITFILLAVFSLPACGGHNDEPFIPEPPEQPEDTEEDDSPDTPAPGANGRYLVLYCSRSGNTEHVARQIQSALGCDILEVEPATPYDNDYNSMLSRAQEELAAIRNGDYPPVKTSMVSFDGYDIVFVGYPIWYGSMATPMQTFLHGHAPKLQNKCIALFATSGSSGISSSVSEAQRLCPEATISNRTLLLTSSTLSQMESRVAAWLEQVGAMKQEPDVSSLKLKITTANGTITAMMEDNAAGMDFMSRLPLEVTLNDYNNTTEKIFNPFPALTLAGVARGCAPVPGDITIYVPWGNVAIFCKSGSYSDDLIKIGHIGGNGVEALRVPGDVRVKFERE